MRFHLVDRIETVDYEAGAITGVKCVPLSDDVFEQHFPGYPVYPGSLVLESLAQLGGSYFELAARREGLPVKRSVLSIVNRLRLRRPVLPGDRMILFARVVSRRDDFGVTAVRAEVDGETCAEGELTFVFLPIDDESLSASRLELYRICMRDTRESP